MRRIQDIPMLQSYFNHRPELAVPGRQVNGEIAAITVL
jgi:hypothetical protein